METGCFSQNAYMVLCLILKIYITLKAVAVSFFHPSIIMRNCLCNFASLFLRTWRSDRTRGKQASQWTQLMGKKWRFNEERKYWLKSELWVNVITCWLWRGLFLCRLKYVAILVYRKWWLCNTTVVLWKWGDCALLTSLSVTSETAGMLVTGQSKDFPITLQMAYTQFVPQQNWNSLAYYKVFKEKIDSPNVCYNGILELQINILMLCGIFFMHRISVN